MKPTVGRVVHYVSHGTPVREDGTQAFPSKCRAATVTEVVENPANSDEEMLAGLAVLNPTGMFFHSLADGGCAYGELPADLTVQAERLQGLGGTWHWPERETEAAPLAGSGA
jgi:hypothetical protein